MICNSIIADITNADVGFFDLLAALFIFLLLAAFISRCFAFLSCCLSCCSTFVSCIWQFFSGPRLPRSSRKGSLTPEQMATVCRYCIDAVQHKRYLQPLRRFPGSFQEILQRDYGIFITRRHARSYLDAFLAYERGEGPLPPALQSTPHAKEALEAGVHV